MHKSKNTIQNYQQNRTHTTKRKNTQNTLPAAPQLPNLHHNHPLSLVLRNFRILAITHPTNIRQNHLPSHIQHIVRQHPQNDDTYEKIIEQPHTITF